VYDALYYSVSGIGGENYLALKHIASAKLIKPGK
jgi:hypothetical protein